MAGIPSASGGLFTLSDGTGAHGQYTVLCGILLQRSGDIEPFILAMTSLSASSRDSKWYSNRDFLSLTAFGSSKSLSLPYQPFFVPLYLRRCELFHPSCSPIFRMRGVSWWPDSTLNYGIPFSGRNRLGITAHCRSKIPTKSSQNRLSVLASLNNRSTAYR